MTQVIRSKKFLKANGEKLIASAQGTSSAIVHVKGTFNGTLRFLGGMTQKELIGERILMQTGVGSLGTNVLTVNGTIDKEFRVVTGGVMFAVEAESWVSGSVEVEYYATEDPSITFINGPIQTSDDQATRAGRSFVASTGGQSVLASQEIYIIWENPSDSGKDYILTERLFGALTSDNVEYVAYANPTATLSESAPAINRRLGSSNTSNAIVSYQVANVGTITMGGVQGSGEPINNTGIPRERKFAVIVPPGQSLGFSIRGAGNNLSQAARLFISLQWFEEEAYA